MTTIAARPPAPLPNSTPAQRTSSPLRYPAPSSQRSTPAHRMSSASARDQPPTANSTGKANSSGAPTPPTASSSSAKQARTSPLSNASPDAGARSPPSQGSARKSSPNTRPPIIRVKKEPASPTTTSSRPRPKRLDLSASGSAARGPQTAGAPSKDSSGLAVKDLSIACLSPGFQTQDPHLREHIQRSFDVREQQRQIIEARQKGSTKALTSHEAIDSAREGPQTSRRKGPPPGLSIHAPAAAAFAHERVIQSAPLHHSFTGLQPAAHPHAPSRLVHHGQVAQQAPSGHPAHRLPSISDVFSNDRVEPAPPSSSFRPAPSAPSPSYPPPAYSPGYPPHQQQAQQQAPSSSRSREFRSAEEAVQGMSGGREELLPKIVHYGGAQPPTPPSPGSHHHQPYHHGSQAREQHAHQPGGPRPQQQQQQQQHHSQAPHGVPAHFHESRPDFGRTSSLSGRRRTREEYERDNGSPAHYQGEFKRHAPDTRDAGGADWRSGMSSREKKDEFLRLCERAWDLFHS